MPNFDTLLSMLDKVLQSALPFRVARDPERKAVAINIGEPIYFIFDLLSNIAATYDLFRLPPFNVVTKKLWDCRENFLRDPSGNSNAVLNTGQKAGSVSL